MSYCSKNLLTRMVFAKCRARTIHFSAECSELKAQFLVDIKVVVKTDEIPFYLIIS